MKYACDLHAVRTTILQEKRNNVYQLHINNIHRPYNNSGCTTAAFIYVLSHFVIHKYSCHPDATDLELIMSVIEQ